MEVKDILLSVDGEVIEFYRVFRLHFFFYLLIVKLAIEFLNLKFNLNCKLMLFVYK